MDQVFAEVREGWLGKAAERRKCSKGAENTWWGVVEYRFCFLSLEGIVSQWLHWAGGYYDVLLLHTLPYCEQSQYLIKKDDKS